MIALRPAFFAAVFAAVMFVPAPAAVAQPTADPDFFWLPPTVTAVPTFTGPFDADALDSLSVEVCELTDGACVDGPPIERMTTFTTPTPMRLKLDAKPQQRRLYACAVDGVQRGPARGLLVGRQHHRRPRHSPRLHQLHVRAVEDSGVQSETATAALIV